MILVFIRFFAGGPEDDWICEKGEWIKHGNPSAPKPSEDCELVSPTVNLRENQIEKCQTVSGKSMGLDEALMVAEEQCKEGVLEIQKEYFCNDTTGTWWIGFDPDEPKEGCNPACVVDVETETAEINWRCTGIIEGN